MGFPEFCGLGIAGSILVTGECGDRELVGLDPEDLCEQGVAEIDGLLLEVVSQGPVTEHLEEGEVTGVSDLIYVSCPDAFLEVHQPLSCWVFLSEKIGDERVHPCGREQYRRIVLRDEGCGTDVCVSPLLEEVDESLSHFLSVHCVHSFLIRVAIATSLIRITLMRAISVWIA